MTHTIDADIKAEDLARAQGCLLGQLVGDALGSMVEFKSVREIRARYPSGLRVVGPSEVHHTIAGQVTDDSELALALAHSLLARSAFDDEDVARAYADWLASRPFDVGNTIRQAAAAMLSARSRGASLAEAGRGAASRSSEANGAMMRQSPLAIWGWRLDKDALVALVRADTTLTHPNQVCQDASAALIVALAATIREGLAGPEAYERACTWDRAHGRSPTVTSALKAAASAPPAFETNAGHVLVALQNAFYQALHAPSLEAGVINTVMSGGDPDTNAAIAGALLGAIHGVDAVPEQWRTAVLQCRPAQGAPGVLNPRPELYWPVDALGLAEKLLRSGATAHAAGLGSGRTGGAHIVGGRSSHLDISHGPDVIDDNAGVMDRRERMPDIQSRPEAVGDHDDLRGRFRATLLAGAMGDGRCPGATGGGTSPPSLRARMAVYGLQTLAGIQGRPHSITTRHGRRGGRRGSP